MPPYGVTGPQWAITLCYSPQTVNWRTWNTSTCIMYVISTLHWRHNGCDGVSNHQPRDCLLNGLFRRRSKKTSKRRVTGLCAGNSPLTGEFPAQRASNAENFSIWWCHHDKFYDTASDCKIPRINVDHTLIRHLRVGLMSTRLQSNHHSCYLWLLYITVTAITPKLYIRQLINIIEYRSYLSIPCKHDIMCTKWVLLYCSRQISMSKNTIV